MGLREITLPLEPLSLAAFAPYGTVMGGEGMGGEGMGGAGRPADFEAEHLWNWRVPFEADGPTQVLLIRYKYSPPVFSLMERHFHVTQGFMPLGGVASAMVVAPPSESDDAQAVPAATAVRAFLLTGEAGVILHRGTWHALQRFPLAPPHIDIAFLTEAATQTDIEASAAAGTPPARTQMVDYAEREGVRFRIEGFGP